MPASRAAIARRQQSRQPLTRRHGSTPNTRAKWRQRATTQDATRGPQPASTGLSPEEEAMAFRQHPQLPLVACLYALQATSARPTRSAPHRLLQRHGSSRRPLRAEESEGKKPGQEEAQPLPHRLAACGVRPRAP
jgi:transposase-like protein